MTSKYTRILNINIPPGQSAWLWGPRKTGKSTYLKDRFSDSAFFDLLDTDLYLAVERQPSLFREYVSTLSEGQKKLPIVVDEVQKVPLLLDEIHRLIENDKLQFLLCGSSARKLKRGHANMLGGRAWRYEMFPLVSPEIEHFDLLRALQCGLVPSHYLSSDPRRSLQAYTADYLNEEIRAEGLTRNLPAFGHFLESAAFCTSEPINYSNIARDVGVDAKTVKEYFHILEDTFTGYLIEPFRKTRRRQIISSSPKFYFFDVGLAGHLSRRTIHSLTGPEAGKAFENFILMEIMAFRSYRNIDVTVSYWRTKTGLEVDFVLGRENPIALEVKIKSRIDKTDLKGLTAFSEEVDTSRSLLVCNESRKRKVEGTSIEIIPWKNFLDELWQGTIL